MQEDVTARPIPSHHATSPIQNPAPELPSIRTPQENVASSRTRVSLHPASSLSVQNGDSLSVSTHSLEPPDDISCLSTSPSTPQDGSASDSLHNSLRQARIRCAKKNNHKFFVPNCELKKQITIEAVTAILQAVLPSTPDACVKALAKTICESAPRLFATLGYIKKVHEIAPLLDEQISDKDFPFELRHPQPPGNRYALQGKGGKEIKSITQWTDEDSEEFHKCQWWMNAPVFKEGAHYNLDDNAMLPFTNRTPVISRGGSSKVYLAEIHPSHHNFSGVKRSDGEGCYVAIKELDTNNPEEDFKKENEFFKTLASKQHRPHRHLINLLATYRWKGKYHLVLPRAGVNLETYWLKTEPDFNEETVRWSLNQMAGLVNGLLDIHECMIRTAAGTIQDRKGSGSSIRLKQGEEKYGRHGDIKPENILWFPPSASDDLNGILKIADFGLGRFHGRDTRSNVDWSKIKSSPTYEPPELKLHKPVSRAYDMWSLACILLEFATWMLEGPRGHENFSNYRGCPDSNPDFRELSNDEFFTMVDRSHTKAVVRESVVEWVVQLHRHKSCSAFIHDLLDLIMGHLLVINPADRYGAVRLDQEFQSFQEKAKDSEYLVKPVPSPAPALH